MGYVGHEVSVTLATITTETVFQKAGTSVDWKIKLASGEKASASVRVDSTGSADQARVNIYASPKDAPGDAPDSSR